MGMGVAAAMTVTFSGKGVSTAAEAGASVAAGAVLPGADVVLQPISSRNGKAVNTILFFHMTVLYRIFRLLYTKITFGLEILKLYGIIAALRKRNRRFAT